MVHSNHKKRLLKLKNLTIKRLVSCGSSLKYLWKTLYMIKFIFISITFSIYFHKASYERDIISKIASQFTTWNVSKYGVISGPYSSVFRLNTGKYGPEITPYLDNFHAVVMTAKIRKSSVYHSPNGYTRTIWLSTIWSSYWQMTRFSL